MNAEVYTRLIKGISGDGSTSVVIKASPLKRVFAFSLQITSAIGTNTLAALMSDITEIRVKVGTQVKWRLTGTQLRDFVLLRGTDYDFNGLPNTGCQITIPLAPEWFRAEVQDALAWNPQALGGDISLEMDTGTLINVVAYETIADNLDAPFAGILTLEVINPVAGSTSFFTTTEVERRGRLVSASIYPDTTNSREITPATLFLDDLPAHEALTSAQNDEVLERKKLAPAATGRTANVYDIVPVKDDMLIRGYDLAAYSKVKFKVEAAAAMAGTCAITLCRLERK